MNSVRFRTSQSDKGVTKMWRVVQTRFLAFGESQSPFISSFEMRQIVSDSSLGSI